MVIKEAVLETVCGITSKLPDNLHPEVAFAGRSNVGKSSLINGLLQRKSLARTSSQPGKTQTINFYKVNKRFFLVDLPGYGYANANLSVKQQWGRMIERYLNRSRQLRAVFLLLDIRHAPKDLDKQMCRWVEEKGIRLILVATKADKLKPREVAARLQALPRELGAPEQTPIVAFSALNRQGRGEVCQWLSAVLEEPGPDSGKAVPAYGLASAEAAGESGPAAHILLSSGEDSAHHRKND